MINHGKKIVRDYRRNKIVEKVKALLGKVLTKVLFGTSVGSVVVAGFFTGNAMVAFHGF